MNLPNYFNPNISAAAQHSVPPAEVKAKKLSAHEAAAAHRRLAPKAAPVAPKGEAPLPKPRAAVSQPEPEPIELSEHQLPRQPVPNWVFNKEKI